MPKRPDFTLRLSIKNVEGFSPDAITHSPRNFRPQDVINACKNMSLEAVSTDIPQTVLAVANFISIDFFGLAHGTGLYNRQIKLWNALSCTSRVEVYMATKGFIQKTKLPEFDLFFLDQKSRLLAAAHYADSNRPKGQFDFLRNMNEFLQRAALIQGLSGLFLCYPDPFPNEVLEYVRKKTKADDTLSHYESIWPKLGVPLNLLEISEKTSQTPDGSLDLHGIRLVHPDLSKKKFGAPRPQI
ncbi:MAG: hypothetical protein K2W82_00810 [Candidatus Obscuribacterales bacterium]|nr:hypothetical protein [Candidatus Obscuribacterales bacterium]